MRNYNNSPSARRGTGRKVKELIWLLFGLEMYCVLVTVSGIGCPIKWLTGISCAGCGMTRALIYAVRLRFHKAFYYHPLYFMIPFCVLLYLFWEKLPVKTQKYVTWAMAAAFLGVYAVRLLYSDHCVVNVDVENSVVFRLWKYFT